MKIAGKNVNDVCEKCNNCEYRPYRVGTREQVLMIYLKMKIFFQRSVINIGLFYIFKRIKVMFVMILMDILLCAD